MPTAVPARDDNRSTLLILGILLAVALLLLWNDWLTVGLGPVFPAYWALVLVWFVSVVLAVRRHRRWWVLLTAAVVLYPAARVALFLIECSQKACLF